MVMTVEQFNWIYVYTPVILIASFIAILFLVGLLVYVNFLKKPKQKSELDNVLIDLIGALNNLISSGKETKEGLLWSWRSIVLVYFDKLMELKIPEKKQKKFLDKRGYATKLILFGYGSKQGFKDKYYSTKSIEWQFFSDIGCYNYHYKTLQRIKEYLRDLAIKLSKI